MATEGTKFQINYKLSDGTLVNLYAASVQELESGLADLAMNATNIKATGIELSGAHFAVAPAPVPTVEAIAAQFAAPVGVTYTAPPVSIPSPPVAVNAAGGVHQCRHGEMAFRSGTSAKGPWKGYMCASPKGATDKCDTIWVR
jgi:hypothetical protein